MYTVKDYLEEKSGLKLTNQEVEEAYMEVYPDAEINYDLTAEGYITSCYDVKNMYRVY